MNNVLPKPCPFCGGELRRGCVWCVIINNTFAKQYDFCSYGERKEGADNG